MCGIAGVYDPHSKPDEGTLTAMNDRVRHRGPDDEGTFLSDTVGLAHQRLSIIDPETGQQPMYNEDGSVVVVFNGEIYNYTQLRKTLTAAGHRFETGADTEVLVHGYEAWGPGLLDRLEGMFAFSLYDSETQRLLLARDPMGIKPLFLARDGRAVAFASEIQALFESPVSTGALDHDALSQYFVFGFVPGPETAFTDVETLQPGTMALVDENGIERERYYAPSREQRSVGFDSAASELRSRLERAVEKRLMSDVPLGAFLSGGIDSSIVVGLMSEFSDEPVRTFTVGFEDAVFDESWAAREVAAFHGTDHHEVTVDPDAVREVIPSVIDRLGQPFADPSLLPTFVVARETARDVTVALSGDGADELFAGYEKYRGEYAGRYYRRLPRVVRRGLVEPSIRRLPAGRGSDRAEFVRKARKFLRAGETDPVHRHLDWLRYPDEAAMAAVPDGGMAAARGTLDAEHQRLDGDGDALSRMLAVDTTFGLPNQMLTKVDLAGMYNSLEVRVPFLDTAVVEYARSLPLSYKITARDRKRILKRAFDDILPTAIENRGKQGFDVPVGEWIKGPLADAFESAVRADPTDVLDTDAVFDIYDDHCTGPGDHSKFLWATYVYARWARRMHDEGVI
jgi:asparagine synthase (glutamine-hydrolysing)